MSKNKNYCQCGCKTIIPKGRKFINHHNIKLICIKEGEHRGLATEIKGGKDHPSYKHGFAPDPSNSARKCLGFKPINRRHEGLVMHHIDHEYVIYIPKELHESIWHRQKSGRGMEQMNKLAWKYLEDNITESQRSLFEFK